MTDLTLEVFTEILRAELKPIRERLTSIEKNLTAIELILAMLEKHFGEPKTSDE